MLYLRFYLHTDDAGRSSPFAIDVERIDYEEGEDEESGCLRRVGALLAENEPSGIYPDSITPKQIRELSRELSARFSETVYFNGTYFNGTASGSTAQ